MMGNARKDIHSLQVLIYEKVNVFSAF